MDGERIQISARAVSPARFCARAVRASTKIPLVLPFFNTRVRKMAESTDFSLLNFPDKLWYMVNEPKCKQIEWNSDGTSIIIPNNHEFVSEVLNNPSKILFKTKNFSSFVRQLNLYGFRKVSEHRRVGQTQPVATNRSEFKHPSFLKDRKGMYSNSRTVSFC